MPDLERGKFPSGSYALRDRLCPGAFAYCSQLSESGEVEAEDSSEDAEEGNLLHKVWLGQPYEEILTDEQEWVTNWARTETAQILNHAGFGDCLRHVEKRLWWHEGPTPIASGKLDLHCVLGRKGIIIDGKFGRALVDPAWGNLQLARYNALLSKNYQLDSCTAVILQPRVGVEDRVTIVEYSSDELRLAVLDWKQTLVTQALPFAPRVPGFIQCNYCPGKAFCPEAKETSLITKKPPSFPELSNADLVWFLDRCKLADRVIAAAKKEARARLEADPEALGGRWFLKKGRRKRTIANANTAYGRMQGVFTPEQFASVAKIQIGALEEAYKKATGLKGKAADDGLTELLGDVLEVSLTEPSLNYAPSK